MSVFPLPVTNYGIICYVDKDRHNGRKPLWRRFPRLAFDVIIALAALQPTDINGTYHFYCYTD